MQLSFSTFECVMTTLAGRRGGWGVNILGDASHRIGLLQSNLSTATAFSLSLSVRTLVEKVLIFVKEPEFTARWFSIQDNWAAASHPYKRGQ
jgi:hypothetical protein